MNSPALPVVRVRICPIACLVGLGMALVARGGETPAMRLVTGFGAGYDPVVTTAEWVAAPLAFHPRLSTAWKGGVRVAAGDVNGDGRADLVGVAEGPAGLRLVVWRHPDGAPAASTALPPGMGTNVSVTTGNLSGDAAAEIIVGSGAGGGPHVRVFDGRTLAETGSFEAFASGFAGGVRVAAGDVDGDGQAEIIAAAADGTGAGVVKIFAGATFVPEGTFEPFGSGHATGINVATGDVDGDGRAEVVCAPSGPHPALSATARVVIHHHGAGGGDEEATPFGDFFNDALSVAAADLDGDGAAEVLAAAPDGAVRVLGAGGGTVRSLQARDVAGDGAPLRLAAGDFDGDGRADVVLSAAGRLRLRVVTPALVDGTFTSGDEGATGGVRVAVGDVTGDGVPDVVTAPGTGAEPQVRVFDGATGLPGLTFMAETPSFTGGVFVATGDLNGDGRADIVTGTGTGGAPTIGTFNGLDGTSLGTFPAFDPSFTGGVRVAVGDVTGDGVPEIIACPGPGAPPTVKVFTPKGTEVDSFAAYAENFTGGVFVAAGDVDGDGVAEILTGTDGGTSAQVSVFDRKHGTVPLTLAAFEGTFRGGVRVAAGDVDGDGVADVIFASGPGRLPVVRAVSLGGTRLMERVLDPVPPSAGVFPAGFTPPTARAAVTGVARAPGGTFTITFTGTTGRWTDVDVSTDGLNWLPLASEPGAGSTAVFADEEAASRPAALYRVRSH